VSQTEASRPYDQPPYNPGGKPITGRTVLIGMVAFFGVVIAVNLVFVYFALSTWPGLTTQHAFEEGRDYNQTLESAARQEAMGWHSRVGLGAPTPKGRVLTLVMTGPDGKPLTGMKVTAVLSRPVGEGLTVDTAMDEERPGLYGALVRLSALGRWEVLIKVQAEDGRSYHMQHEVQAGGTK